MEKNVIAIGGGGFGRSTGNLKIERYLINCTNSKKPKICFIPTASGDDNAYKVSFYDVFTQLQCHPSHIDLFKRTKNLKDQINNQDIIYVGGGNTKSMIALWKDWGLDQILKEAYKKGIIMSGVSAGAICWFDKGITDSYAEDLSIINCLNFIDGVCCPHYDEEESRIPYVKEALQKKLINECISIEGNCALHLKDGKAFRSISFGSNKKTYLVSLDKGRIISKEYKSKQI